MFYPNSSYELIKVFPIHKSQKSHMVKSILNNDKYLLIRFDWYNSEQTA
jgi:hypothetical protein